MTTAGFSRPNRGFLDFIGAALCLWAAAYHTPVGALLRGLVSKLTSTHTTARPLLAYYTGGVYDAQDIEAPTLTTAVPDVEIITAIPPGRALGRGVFASANQLPPEQRRVVDAFARRYALPLASPEDAAALVDRAKADLRGSEDAAVLAVFAGYDVASYATERASSEGRDLRLETLAANLPPGSAKAIDAASTALMLGTAYGLSWPVAPGTRVSSPFGWRQHPILGRGQFHSGVDLAVPEGTTVKAVADGTVRRASEDAVNGRVVIIEHGRGVSTAYCHNSELLVRTGQQVKAGDTIAYSGTTGRSTGPHVHYQLELGHKPMDPFAFRGSRPLVLEPPPQKPDGAKQLKKAFDRLGPPPASEE